MKTPKKPSEVEVIAMALWWTRFYPSCRTTEWKNLSVSLKAIYREDARAFLRALRRSR